MMKGISSGRIGGLVHNSFRTQRLYDALILGHEIDGAIQEKMRIG